MKDAEINELWHNPLFSLEDRLEIADGAVKHRDKVIKNLRNQLKEQQNLDNPEQSTYNESSAITLLKEIAMSNMTKEQIKKKAKEFLWPGSVIYKH